MSNTRIAPLAIAIIAAAFVPAAWAAEAGEPNKDQTASQTTQAKDQDASAPASKEVDAKQAQGNGAESAAKAQEPAAKAPQRRRVVTAAEIEDMNRRYPGG